MISKITTKGQVTLPQKIREELGVGLGDFIDFQIKNKTIIIKPIHAHAELMDLKEILKAKRSATDEEINNPKTSPLKNRIRLNELYF
ncbi:MAG: AbrB/MazE/SpoVT family DNA-binding domain-containing protein [bacterium]